MLNTRRRRPGLPFRAAAFASIAVVLAIVAVSATNVFAHAGYDSSTPADGEVLATAPERVDVYFLQQVARYGGLPTLVVVNDAGDQVATGATLDDDDRTHMFADLEEGLDDGEYTVIWHTLSSDDGEEAQGAFTFYVGSGPTTAPSGSGAATTNTPAATNNNVDDEDDGGDLPIWALIAGIAGGLVVGAGAGLVLGRRNV